MLFLNEIRTIIQYNINNISLFFVIGNSTCYYEIDFATNANNLS